ncbi:CDP-alcohol phosphatidyltransferase family protein [Nitrosomonas sp. Nm58]|jgi:phosphatidylglycerophosphate synthase|uniref:CDP-alcohol phosphatidyltransferase family protein n=1 Tax=Nitrosomonas sp. Nm58 TaxID=200126 RepID=UPI0008995549|nr:CDP-alcohol phosphatidyltransferase family protein [Nitrosomonas sp. Nm58]SDY53760.1 Phosphatidylglycerophosphate synthase [Nitrosomonas sp. Nm58]
MSTTYLYIFGESEINLWGLSGRERLQRLATSLKQTRLADNLTDIPEDAPALLLRADHLFDARVIAALSNLQEDIVLCNQSSAPVAIRTEGKNVPALLEALRGTNTSAISGMKQYTLKDLQTGVQQNLKKKESPYVLPISVANRKALEWELFAGSYKGVTDLVTKWLWPVPAFWATHLCVRWKVTPNQVTLLSLILAVFAGIAFWYGYYASGLIMGWLMTFLDTVDGKLARVTLTSSRLGDVMDHGLDLVHPPLWYLAWGAGLATTAVPLANLELLAWLMFASYVGGRLCEGLFEFWLAPFVMFIWQQIDSFNRLITARRNPNLILMTLSWLADRPDIGFLLIVGWHVISTLFLAWRVIVAWQTRRQQGSLTSWMEAIDPIQDRQQLAVRVFTRVPLAEKNGSTLTNP